MKKLTLSIISVTWLLLLPAFSFACSCDLDTSLLRKPEDQQIKIARKRAKAVFSGKVVEITIDEKTKTYRAKFKVQNSWKNMDTDEVIISGTTICCICEYVFKGGESYLIYADRYDRAKNEYGTNICTRTRPLTEAEKDLKVLGKGKIHNGEMGLLREWAQPNNSFNPSPR